jgi:hypothetical protein
MIEVERAGVSPACACVPSWSDENSPTVAWLALLKTSAEMWAALCPQSAAFEVGHNAPTHPVRCVVASGGGSFARLAAALTHHGRYVTVIRGYVT